MKKISLKRLIKNVYYLLTEDTSNKKILHITEKTIEELEKKQLLNRVISAGINMEYKLEVAYLIDAIETPVFPYKKLKCMPNFEAGIDERNKMPYVIHNGKKLFFPSDWTLETTTVEYKKFIQDENILGGNYKAKAPHQYESKKYFIKEGDVLFDIGCAEGLFALHHIEKVSKVYLLEGSPVWHKALEATFAPYNDKITIIPKFVSNVSHDTTITLTELIGLEKNKSLFMKMDIEGYEISVLESGKEILNQNGNITFACCTYHKQDDANRIETFFKNINYNTEFSDGYMLFIYDNEFNYPFFRKGLIRASRQ